MKMQNRIAPLPQNDESDACAIDKQKSDAAFRRLPYATTGPNTWTDVGWLTEQRRVYTRNRDQWYAVGFAAFTAIGMNADDARKSLRNPSGRIVTGRGHVLAALGAAATGAIAAEEIARYQDYINGINDRLEYLRGCTSIR